MSITVRAGDTIALDPNDQRVVEFDWDTDNLATAASITSSVFTITALKVSVPANLLTKDTPTILVGNRKTQIRLLATTATLGDRYEVANTIITDESPTQTKEQSIQVVIEQQ